MGRLLITVVALAAILTLSRAGTTPKTACKAAAGSDKRINYNFCVAQLYDHHESTEADMWGLAKITALIGANNAGSASFDIKALLAKPSTDPKMRAPLEQCKKLYDTMADEFAVAHDDINSRNYAAGKEEVAETIPLGQKCEDAFVKPECHRRSRSEPRTRCSSRTFARPSPISSSEVVFCDWDWVASTTWLQHC
ncbi:hypothetical protein ACP4OV_006485 [Aristida adscensionis]